MSAFFRSTVIGIISRPVPVLAAATVCIAIHASAAETVIGSGHVISETRSVSGFHGVELIGSSNLIVTQGDKEGLVIEAEDNILPLLESTVADDGILHLGFKNHQGKVETKKDVTFKLTARTLDRMALIGSGSIHADSMTADHTRLDLPGSGDITVDHLQTGDVAVELDGSGDVKLAGSAHGQKININGSGTYTGEGLKADDVTVHINGSGDANIWANTSLSVEINGSGEVGYHGSPTVKKSVHGSGEVRSLGGKEL